MKRKYISVLLMIAAALSMQACRQTAAVPDSSSAPSAGISVSSAVSGAPENGMNDKEKNYEIAYDEKNNQYRYTVYDNSNAVLDSQDSLKSQPKISRISQDILKLQIDGGTDAGSCRFYNVTGGIESEWFPVISLAETEDLFAYIDYSKKEVIVQKIFAPSEYCKMFPVEMTKVTDKGFSAQFIDGGKGIEVVRNDDDGSRKVYTFTLS